MCLLKNNTRKEVVRLHCTPTALGYIRRGAWWSAETALWFRQATSGLASTRVITLYTCFLSMLQPVSTNILEKRRGWNKRERTVTYQLVPWLGPGLPWSPSSSK